MRGWTVDQDFQRAMLIGEVHSSLPCRVTAPNEDYGIAGISDGFRLGSMPFTFAFDHKHRRAPMELRDLLGGKGGQPGRDDLGAGPAGAGPDHVGLRRARRALARADSIVSDTDVTVSTDCQLATRASTFVVVSSLIGVDSGRRVTTVVSGN